MSIAYLIPVSVLVLGIATSFMLSSRSRVARIFAALALGGAFLFCLFGFLTTFEPSESSRLPWQIGYAMLGVASLSGAFVLLRRR